MNPSDFTAKEDIPYSLMTPGEWEFSGSGYETGVDYEVYHNTETWYLGVATGNPDNPYVELEQVAGDADNLSVDFVNHQITATRSSLPGNLLDRAMNIVNVSTTTILTLPASQYEDKARNLYVNFNIQDSA